jgi:hypothetical protein
MQCTVPLLTSYLVIAKLFSVVNKLTVTKYFVPPSFMAENRQKN